MTLNDAIEKVDSVKPNAYSAEEKTAWISELDGKIYAELLTTHRAKDVPETFSAYVYPTDKDRELLASFPYDGIYMLYVMAQIDFHNADIGRYNNSIQAFYTAWSDYSNAYTRTYMPKGEFIRL